ncbi:MAG: hypothetical protein JXR20_13035, partial [Balneola sp.]
MKSIFLVIIFGVASPFSSSIVGQDKSNNPIKSLNAFRVPTSAEINIDGRLVEEIWNRTENSSGFTQRFPNDGSSASERTTVRVAYSDEHVFIAIRAFDSSPDSIAATLFRRDGNAYSDWVYVS